MPRYVIARDIADIGTAQREALRDAARKSNCVLSEMKAERMNIQWEHSYVAGNKTFCIYLADSEALVHEHAKRSGFPATKVTEIRKMIDPVTAEG
jgi:cell division inhibitor SulA